MKPSRPARRSTESGPGGTSRNHCEGVVANPLEQGQQAFVPRPDIGIAHLRQGVVQAPIPQHGIVLCRVGDPSEIPEPGRLVAAGMAADVPGDEQRSIVVERRLGRRDVDGMSVSLRKRSPLGETLSPQAGQAQLSRSQM